MNGIEGLTRRESQVMRAVYTLSSGKERFLVTLYELLCALPKRGKFDEESWKMRNIHLTT